MMTKQVIWVSLSTKPKCFDTQKQFQEWRHLARVAYEATTICEDCSPEFRTAMKVACRCDEHVWRDKKFGARSDKVK